MIIISMVYEPKERNIPVTTFSFHSQKKTEIQKFE